MKRNVMIAAAVAVTAVVGGGTAASAALGSDDEPARATTENETGNGTGNETEAVAAPADTSAGSTADEALATALADTPGVVTEIERGDGWEVEILGDDGEWYKVRVGEDGTEVLGSRVDTDDTDDDDDDDGDDDADDRAAAGAAGIDVAEAVALAEAETSAVLSEASLDDGRWKLELRGDDGREHELTIDPSSGEITSHEQETERDGSGTDDTDDSDSDSSDDSDDSDTDDDDTNENENESDD
ncbi:PepSY domain-containing protein [Streptomyces sp. NBC_01803]|uniref:PepSY domain-containing protein n=1 Tax=Streptomyces sp. NBC_01803 TaxID=2975946 RepID=UPI002DDBBCB1|nr:PepSY domain-containing protein [Streptomyces sp. NBC_01803]WSA44135.1 hypothetical protein OIE51_07895 [Streptomyces sp. NBC_01803]